MIQVINRAFNILELLAHDRDKEVGLSTIADTLELNHGTCANILKTLVNRGYVEQAGAKKGYKLGHMIYQLANSDEYYIELINSSKTLMDELRNVIDETVILSVLMNDKRVLVHESLCNHELQVRTTQESSAYRATTGRIILAHYSPKELNDFIERVGLPTKEDWPEVSTKAQLLQLLNEISKKDIEITWNQNHVAGLATPIFKKDKIIASLGVFLPDSRFSESKKNAIVKNMLLTTKVIERKLKS